MIGMAAIAFYVSSRIVRTDWGSDSANGLRMSIVYALYVFSVILLMMTLTQIPKATDQWNQPQAPKENVIDRERSPLGDDD